jgi:hypothetical protein
METRYRFFFNPIRYTSLGLAVCEAMMLGMPIIGLATTEMVTAVQNGVNGYVDTNVAALVEHMQRLLEDRTEAAELSRGACRIARERFGIERFVRNWDAAFQYVAGTRTWTGFSAKGHATEAVGTAAAESGEALREKGSLVSSPVSSVASEASAAIKGV